MNFKFKLLMLILSAYVIVNSNAQTPLVYEVENYGASCEKPLLPDPGEL